MPKKENFCTRMPSKEKGKFFCTAFREKQKMCEFYSESNTKNITRFPEIYIPCSSLDFQFAGCTNEAAQLAFMGEWPPEGETK